jgi:hypothetical protein
VVSVDRLPSHSRLNALAIVRRTPGISCERPIRSTLVCFIPLFDALVFMESA